MVAVVVPRSSSTPGLFRQTIVVVEPDRCDTKQFGGQPRQASTKYERSHDRVLLPHHLQAAEAMAGMDAARLGGVIRDGLPGTSMPAWRHVLDGDEIDALVRYIDAAFHPVIGAADGVPAGTWQRLPGAPGAR